MTCCQCCWQPDSCNDMRAGQQQLDASKLQNPSNWGALSLPMALLQAHSLHPLFPAWLWALMRFWPLFPAAQTSHKARQC